MRLGLKQKLWLPLILCLMALVAVFAFVNYQLYQAQMEERKSSLQHIVNMRPRNPFAALESVTNIETDRRLLRRALTDAGRETVGPGTCIGFPAGTGDGHHFRRRPAAPSSARSDFTSSHSLVISQRSGSSRSRHTWSTRWPRPPTR